MPGTRFDEALHRILSTLQPLPTENVVLAQALGRVAAATVVAEDAVPFPRSAMDGYAVRAGLPGHVLAHQIIQSTRNALLGAAGLQT
jgi:molybdopterin biosynthesis enzyme